MVLLISSTQNALSFNDGSELSAWLFQDKMLLASKS